MLLDTISTSEIETGVGVFSYQYVSGSGGGRSGFLVHTETRLLARYVVVVAVSLSSSLVLGIV